jgi:hypothetical protein
MNKNKILIILLAILAIIVSGLLILNQTRILKSDREKPSPVKQADLPPAPKYTKTDLPTDKLPDVFPKDLIQEKDPVILESYQAEIGGNETQYSIKYLSKNGLETNKQLYTKYLFNINKWITLNKTSDAKSFYFQAGKGMDTIYISFVEPNLMEITLVRLNADLKFSDINPNNK